MRVIHCPLPSAKRSSEHVSNWPGLSIELAAARPSVGLRVRSSRNGAEEKRAIAWVCLRRAASADIKVRQRSAAVPFTLLAAVFLERKYQPSHSGQFLWLELADASEYCVDR